MDSETASVLIVVDRAPIALAAFMASCGLDVTSTSTGEVSVHLEARLFDACIVPVDDDPATTELVSELRERCAETPVVALGPERLELIHRALAAGAVDYLPWPTKVETTRKLVQHLSMRNRVAALAASQSPKTNATGLLGNSPQLAAARDLLTRAAGGMTTVLVRGETGTGKDLAARAIHTQSQRSSGPFIKVHTPAVPDALLESELFGYEKGAFTGATGRKPGRVELAEGGTLFLDEIGEISQVMQAKLLRLLQDREFERLGGTRTLHADIRVVAATHRDLEHLVANGSFREDLFYRLKVVTIWLPPLRARREDISVIAQHYLDHFSSVNGKRVQLEPAALGILKAERWPGNVRQLVNFLERLVVLATSDVIHAEDVRRELDEQEAFLTQGILADAPAPRPAIAAEPGRGSPEPAAVPPPPVVAPVGSPPSGLHFSSAVRPLKEDLRSAELRAITKALHVAKGNRALAARLLGVSRRTLYTKLEEHGIE